MQDLSSVEFFSASIQPLHPVIYATAIVLLLCLLTIIGSYVYHHRQTKKKSHEALTLLKDKAVEISSLISLLYFQVRPCEPQVLAHVGQPLLPHGSHLRHLHRRHKSDAAR